EQQNRRDQRAGVADTDPPDEVDDGKTPADRVVDAPDAGALEHQVDQRHQQELQDAEADQEADEPAERRLADDEATDLVGDRPEVVPWRKKTRSGYRFLGVV